MLGLGPAANCTGCRIAEFVRLPARIQRRAKLRTRQPANASTCVLYYTSLQHSGSMQRVGIRTCSQKEYCPAASQHGLPNPSSAFQVLGPPITALLGPAAFDASS